MGTFIYDNTPAEFDDRVLAHLEALGAPPPPIPVAAACVTLFA